MKLLQVEAAAAPSAAAAAAIAAAVAASVTYNEGAAVFPSVSCLPSGTGQDAHTICLTISPH